MSRTDRAASIVAAPPEAVFQAFATADALMAWLPPPTMTGRALEYDFRPGGRYVIELTYDDSAAAHAGKTEGRRDVSRGQFTAIEADARIVQTVEFDSPDPAFAGEMTMTWTFDLAAAGTRVTVTATDVPAGIGAADHAEGLTASLRNLAAYVTRQR